MSITVTSLPRRRNACAISQPMGPPPTTSSDGTGSRRSNTVSLVRYGTSATPGIGGTAGREPVAITNVFAVRRRPATSNAAGPVKRPSPKMTSTPRPRKRSGLSLGSISPITARTRVITRARSTCGSTGGSAQRSAWRIWCAMRADFSSDLDGTQPYQRQSPPSRCFSTSATFAPSVAAPAATTRPPEPPPITTISNSVATSGCVPLRCRRAAATGAAEGSTRESRGTGPSYRGPLFASARAGTSYCRPSTSSAME